jgi:exodeoxyribonuclease VII small subunit
MNQEINYSEAYAELQEIITAMEQGDISVDELSEKVKRASELLSRCKNKLYQTEEDVNQIFAELNGNAGA